MNKQFSIYLDLLRFIAALMVFISHIPGFTEGFLWQLAGLGHEAVVFFFILSGYVIAYVCFDKKEQAFDYAINRLTRIYSVAVPAVLLTVLLYYIGHALNPSAFTTIDQKLSNPFTTILLAFTFLNQSWQGITLFINTPYWSLGYEVLYYIFFGVLIFVEGNKKYFLLFLLLCIMGPSIIIYLPIWLLGVLCFLYKDKFKIAFLPNLLLYFFTLLLTVLLVQGDCQTSVNEYALSIFGEVFYSFLLTPADKFASDYFLAILVSIHLYSAYHLLSNLTVFNDYFANLIRKVASHTFSMYLYHMPIMFFIYAIFPYHKAPLLLNLVQSIGVFIIVIFLSHNTENQKYRFKRFFARSKKLPFLSKIKQ